jgi:hypothetical protein
VSQSYIEHRIEVPNERWDTIAYKYYGDANRTAPLIHFNRALFETGPSAIPCILDIGLVIKVPVLAPDPVASHLLPPWKRGS